MDFDRLASRHKDAVYRQMLRVCGNAEDAEDVLVESLIKAYRALPTLRDEAAFGGWLAMIARRACGRLKRQEALHPLLALNEEVPSTNEENYNHVKSCLLTAFDALPEAYQTPYRLFALENLSQADVASRLGLGVNTVKTRIRRARQMLRKQLDASICGEP